MPRGWLRAGRKDKKTKHKTIIQVFDCGKFLLCMDVGDVRNPFLAGFGGSDIVFKLLAARRWKALSSSFL
jgi:hypothetical protein